MASLNRYRWLQAKHVHSMSTFARKLEKMPFTAESGDGFLIDQFPENHLIARFVEDRSFRGIIQDPFGREIPIERVRFAQTEFVLRSTFPQIELRNASRSMHLFTTRLSEASGFSMSIEPCIADVLRWSEKLRSLFPEQFKIRAMQVSDVQLKPDILARILVAGNGDIPESTRAFVGKKLHTITQIQVTMGTDHGIVNVALSSDGTVRTNGRVNDDLRDALKDTLVMVDD